MKIAITSQGKELDSEIDPRFGRCRYFIIYDLDSDQYESVENGNQDLGGGAGIQTAQNIASKNVHAVLTGYIGPNAFKTLLAAGIVIYSDVSGIVSDGINQNKQGNLNVTSRVTVDSHFGMNTD